MLSAYHALGLITDLFRVHQRMCAAQWRPSTATLSRGIACREQSEQHLPSDALWILPAVSWRALIRVRWYDVTRKVPIWFSLERESVTRAGARN